MMKSKSGDILPEHSPMINQEFEIVSLQGMIASIFFASLFLVLKE
ncbi:hypothetical protein [Thalassotalea profundi]|nr:hypothetical protein [Thalassotalea profundi]